MADIICTPDLEERSLVLPKHGADYYETQGNRPQMEDALAILHEFNDKELQSITELSPLSIGHRIWTAHRQINEDIRNRSFLDGSTASTTLYDGRGNIITATLADASSFVVVYDIHNNLRAVKRLNSVTHTFKNNKEVDRVTKMADELADDIIFNERFWGNLAVARSIGDHHMNDLGRKDYINANSQIDIINLEELYEQYDIPACEVGSVKIISCCDGFTDGAGIDQQDKEGHEAYLQKCLQKKSSKKSLSEHLVCQALDDGSNDNISIAIQDIVTAGIMSKDVKLIGIYDGHYGPLTASYTAHHIGPVFKSLILLNEKDYSKLPESIYRQHDCYYQDHSGESIQVTDNESGYSLHSLDKMFFFGATRPSEETKIHKEAPDITHSL